MGWKGTLRSLQADAHSREREARRRQRALERKRLQLQRMEEIERAAHETQVYENYIDVLLSLHTDCGEPWDWQAIHTAPPPAKPESFHEQERAAKIVLDTFSPGITDKLLRRVQSRQEELIRAVEQAKEEDERVYEDAIKKHESDYADWQATRELAARILKGDPSALTDVVVQVRPFRELEELGSSVRVHADSPSAIQATVFLNEQVIPKESKTLLKSGKLSVKPLTRTKFYSLYQDFACSCLLRVARELFALLPVEMAVITLETELLNTQTGHLEVQPILSAAVPRETMEALNLDMLDPSDSMDNFVHRMDFLQTKGFRAVEPLTRSDFET